MRMLYITGRENDFYLALRNQVADVCCSHFFSSDSRAAKLARRLVTLMPGTTIAPFLNTWADQLHRFDVVVIHGTIFSRYIAAELIRRGCSDKLVHWFWNPITASDRIELLKQQRVPIYTFDPADAQRFGLNLETTYYFSSLAVMEAAPQIDCDIFFVGGDKGRLSQLLALRQRFTDLGLSCTFDIIDTGHRPSSVHFAYAQPIPYSVVLMSIRKTRCLLDLVQKGQSGLTQRPLEALFHNKKLITNDANIVNQDFYCEENIFILGKNDLAGLSEFVQTPFRPVDPAITARYDFANWMHRIASAVVSRRDSRSSNLAA